MYVKIFSDIDRLRQLHKYYHKCQKVNEVHLQWFFERACIEHYMIPYGTEFMQCFQKCVMCSCMIINCITIVVL